MKTKFTTELITIGRFLNEWNLLMTIVSVGKWTELMNQQRSNPIEIELYSLIFNFYDSYSLLLLAVKIPTFNLQRKCRKKHDRNFWK